MKEKERNFSGDLFEEMKELESLDSRENEYAMKDTSTYGCGTFLTIYCC